MLGAANGATDCGARACDCTPTGKASQRGPVGEAACPLSTGEATVDGARDGVCAVAELTCVHRIVAQMSNIAGKREALIASPQRAGEKTDLRKTADPTYSDSLSILNQRPREST